MFVSNTSTLVLLAKVGCLEVFIDIAPNIEIPSQVKEEALFKKGSYYARLIHRLIEDKRIIVKGDSLSHSIDAASVVAKVTRDRTMSKLHDQYPQYNFHVHKGYGTAEHLRLLNQFGPCEVHRKCFRPIANMSSQRFTLSTR